MAVTTDACGVMHVTKECSSTKVCQVEGCNKKHHTTLHEHFVMEPKKNGGSKEGEPEKKDIPKMDEKPPDAEGKKEEKAEGGGVKFNGLTGSSPKDVFLMIVPVCLEAADGKTFETHALLDDGSESTLMREDVAEKLGIPSKPKSIGVITVVKKESQSAAASKVSVKVSSVEGRPSVRIDSAYAVGDERFNMPFASKVHQLGGRGRLHTA